MKYRKMMAIGMVLGMLLVGLMPLATPSGRIESTNSAVSIAIASYRASCRPSMPIAILDKELINTSIQSLAFDEAANRLYVGTMKGLNIVNIDNLSVTNLTYEDGLAGNNTIALDMAPSKHLLFMGFLSIPSPPPALYSPYYI